MEKMNNHPWQDDYSAAEPVEPPKQEETPVTNVQYTVMPEKDTWKRNAGKKDMVFGYLAVLCSLMLCNFTLYGGFNLGFALGMCACILCAAGYLLAKGGRLSFYSGGLLLLSLGISAGFARSDDGNVKFWMVLFLIVSVNLALCLMAGQNRRQVGSIRSLGDAFRSVFTMGYGQIPGGMSLFFSGFAGKGSGSKKIGSVLVGVLIMLPVLAILLPLLIKADAAFEGMMQMLPELNLSEAIVTVLCAGMMFCVFYSRVAALANRPKDAPVAGVRNNGLNQLTVNTVLVGVAVVYLLYLVSQLAYFVSGFAGMVPDGYTVAQYARRGFFEMAAICGINMGLIAVAVAFVRKKEGVAPLSTRLLCLFVGLVTLFMVAASSAKMATYIGSFGLTRLRVLTQLIIVFLGIAALVVSINLFVKKPRYMPVLLIAALLLGGTAFWVDVDTLVAAYNVNAYQKGVLETVDVEYLGTLSDGAVPYIAQLTSDSDPKVAEAAQFELRYRFNYIEDFRDWNYTKAVAKPYLPEEQAEEDTWDQDLFADFYEEY